MLPLCTSASRNEVSCGERPTAQGTLFKSSGRKRRKLQSRERHLGPRRPLLLRKQCAHISDRERMRIFFFFKDKMKDRSSKKSRGLRRAALFIDAARSFLSSVPKITISLSPIEAGSHPRAINFPTVPQEDSLKTPCNVQLFDRAFRLKYTFAVLKKNEMEI